MTNSCLDTLKTRYGTCARGTIGTAANGCQSHRYDYFGESHRLVIRMPTGLHELFIDRVEDTIRCQLRAIGRGSGRPAIFAEKVRPARSTRIFFPVDNAPPNTKSKHEPDASFWHVSAEYPGVIIEVSCSQKRKMVSRLAEDYLLDSDTLVRVVVGLDIEYGKKDSHRATLSVWRTQVVYGHEVRVVAVIAVFPVLRKYFFVFGF